MSKDVVSRKLSVHQERELLLKLEDAGLGKEEARLIIGSKDNELARKIVELVETESMYITVVGWIEVDYSRPFTTMIKAGKYNDVIAENFPIKGRGKHKLEAILFDFSYTIGSNDVLSIMNEQYCRPGKIEELLALGELSLNGKCPHLQKEFMIAALGSGLHKPGDDYGSVPVLEQNASERSLWLFDESDRWDSGFSFLAFRK